MEFLSDMANVNYSNNNRPKFEFCSMFYYDVTMTFVFELVCYNNASKTFMTIAI